jgi:hypothetical protein
MVSHRTSNIQFLPLAEKLCGISLLPGKRVFRFFRLRACSDAPRIETAIIDASLLLLRWKPV